MKYENDKAFYKEQRRLRLRVLPCRIRLWSKRFTFNKEKRNRAKEDYLFEFSKKSNRQILEEFRQVRQAREKEAEEAGSGKDSDNTTTSHALIDLPKPDDSLAEGFYFTPKYIFASDIVSSNDIDKVRRGLKELLLHQYCNKLFFNPGTSTDSIEKLRSYEPGASFWSNIGYIDLGNYKELRDVIDFAEVSICNLNDSYFMILVQLYLSEQEQNKLAEIIEKNPFYDYNEKYFSEHITGRISRRRRKLFIRKGLTTEQKNKILKSIKPGGRVAIASGERSFGKMNLLDKEYDRIKRHVFTVIGKYLDLELMQRNIVQPAFILYGTNIDDDSIEEMMESEPHFVDKNDENSKVDISTDHTGDSGSSNKRTKLKKERKVSTQFLFSLGIPAGNGKSSGSYKAFFSDKTKSSVVFSHGGNETNRYMVYIKDRLPKVISSNDSAEDEFLMNFGLYFKEYAKFDYQSFLYADFRDTIIEFRSEIGKKKIKAGSYKRLLEIKNKYYRELNFYNSASNIYDPFKSFEVKDSFQYIDEFRPKAIGLYEYFKSRPSGYLKSFLKTSKREADEKIEACRDLSDKRQVTKTNVMTVVSIIIALISLIIAIIALTKPEGTDTWRWVISRL